MESPWSMDGDFGYGDSVNHESHAVPPNLVLDDEGKHQPTTKQSSQKKKKKKLLPINMNIKTKVSTAGSYQASSTDRSGFGGGEIHCSFSSIPHQHVPLPTFPSPSPPVRPHTHYPPTTPLGPRRANMPSLYDSGSSGWSIIGIYEKVRVGVVAGLDYFGVGSSTTRYSYEPVSVSEGNFGGGGGGGGGGGSLGGGGLGAADIRTCCVIS